MSMKMHITKYPFRYMVINIYGNERIRNACSNDLFKIINSNYDNHKTSLISTDVINYKTKLSQYCNNKYFNEYYNYNIVINSSCIINISDIYDNNYFINKISNGIYKPINLYAYNKQLLSNEHVINDIITLPINYTYCFDSKINRKINLIDKIINNLYE